MSNPSFIDRLFSLKGQTALITGASSGIGAHAARVLSKAGANVVVLARRADRLQELAARLENTRALSADLTQLYRGPGFEALAGQVSEVFGPPTILVNAAGVNLRQHADQVTPEGWRDTIDLNLSVPFFLAQALVPAMKATGGSLINFASLQSYRAFTNGLAYGASKGGIVQLTRAMAQAWSAQPVPSPAPSGLPAPPPADSPTGSPAGFPSPSGISANAIAPGFFPTELTGPVFADDAVSKMHAQATAVGRNGTMADLTTTLIYLSAPASRYVTGQVIPVEGGYLST